MRASPEPKTIFNDFPIGRLSPRTFRVWQRNFDTFLRLWRTESWPPFVDPLLYILALGLGLGAYVQEINGLSYLQFIAPAFVATAGMFTASFECTFGAFVRLEFQRTYDAMLATPLSLEEIVMGEVLWGATRAAFASFAVMVVISLGFGLLDFWAIGLALPVAFLQGLLFSALAMIFTAVVPAIDSFNYYITLGLTPMFVFSGVFFPIEQYPELLQHVAWFIPLFHAVQLQRAIALEQWTWALGIHLVWIIIVAVFALHVALVLMRRRMIK